MFQFRRFPSYAYLIQRRMAEYCSAGFPHSEISGSMLMCSSPKLIAACHVLLRLLMPRHSPCALSSLTSSGQVPYPSLPCKHVSSLTSLSLLLLANPLALGFARIYGSQELCRPQSSLATLFYPFQSSTICVCPLLLASHAFNLHCSVFKVQLPASFKTRLKYPISRILQSSFELSSEVLFASFFFQEKGSGGPKWTRTTDLTIISRAL